MALTEPPKTNVTKEQRQAALREIISLKREAAQASSRLQSAYKKWARAGVPSAGIRETIKARDMDPDALVAELRDKFAAMEAANIQISAEDLFPETVPVKVTDKAMAEQLEWEAHNAGYKAGLAGIVIDDNPFPAGVPVHVKWIDGWHDGQADLVKRMEVAGEQATEKVPASRSRPAPRKRKVKGALPDVEETSPGPAAEAEEELSETAGEDEGLPTE